MHGCTHLSRFALVSRVFPGRNAKKYTGHCIIACVPMCVRTPVIIQFGVSYRQVEVGAKWVQIELCKLYRTHLFLPNTFNWTLCPWIGLSIIALDSERTSRSFSFLPRDMHQCSPYFQSCTPQSESSSNDCKAFAYSSILIAGTVPMLCNIIRSLKKKNNRDSSGALFFNENFGS